MNKQVLGALTLFLLMLVTGVFWGTWFTLTRSIESFSAEEFTHIGKVIIANVAVSMRIIMPSCILLLLLSLWYYNRQRATQFYLGVLAFVLLLAVLLITLLVLVPIDNNIREWTITTMPQDFCFFTEFRLFFIFSAYQPFQTIKVCC